MKRLAEDLWWFEDGQGTVAFPMSRDIILMRDHTQCGWNLTADGRRYFVPDETIERRRFYFPLFPRGQLQEGGWRLMGSAG